VLYADSVQYLRLPQCQPAIFARFFGHEERLSQRSTYLDLVGSYLIAVSQANLAVSREVLP
jgi:hypothetical protein